MPWDVVVPNMLAKPKPHFFPIAEYTPSWAEYGQK